MLKYLHTTQINVEEPHIVATTYYSNSSIWHDKYIAGLVVNYVISNTIVLEIP